MAANQRIATRCVGMGRFWIPAFAGMTVIFQPSLE
jgi:hypothetical protein